jgi:hypothetical protein
MITGAWGTCPVCKKMRRLKSGGMKPHRRWNGKEMVLCSGTGRRPK